MKNDENERMLNIIITKVVYACVYTARARARVCVVRVCMCVFNMYKRRVFWNDCSITGKYSPHTLLLIINSRFWTENTLSDRWCVYIVRLSHSRVFIFWTPLFLMNFHKLSFSSRVVLSLIHITHFSCIEWND